MRRLDNGTGVSRRGRSPKPQSDPRFDERLQAINDLRRKKGWPTIKVGSEAPPTERALRHFAERSGVELPP